MTITVTDQHNTSGSQVYRAELCDKNSALCGLGFGMTKSEAIAEAWTDCIERIARRQAVSL